MVGKNISKILNNGVKSTIIVSPYISNIDEILDIEKSDSSRIICNAESSSCNPYTLLNLNKNNKIKIKSRNDIHAKVYKFDNVAFISSANATPNGLGSGSIEVAIKTTNKKILNETNDWFNEIWDDRKSNDISNFSDEKWRKLKSNWNLNNRRKNVIPDLYDLLVTKSLPENTSFIFWSEGENIPEKKDVEEKTKKEDILELPKNNENWDFWIEEENIKKGSKKIKIIEDLLEKYYNHTMVSLKEFKTTKNLCKNESFLCQLLYKPVILEYKNNNFLVSLYKTNNIIKEFKIDKKTIDLINFSKVKNDKKWIKYLETKDGSYGFCTSEQLYQLLDGCI